MKVKNLSVKRLFGRVALGLVLSMSGITIALFFVTKQTAVLLTGGALLLCALVGIFVLTQAFGKRLSQFTADLCQTLDHMIAGNEAPQRPEDSETQLARIGHRLARLYQIMQENRRRVDEERQELQTLVSDISHQVKTPVSNLKMATDTLLEKPMTEAERTDFIRGIRSQTDKLDFLFQALVKTSRLETGVIQLDKKLGRLFDTVAQAMSGIVYAAEKKEIAAARGSHNGHKFTVIYREVHTVKGASDVRLCTVILFQINRLQNAHTQNSFQGFLPVDKGIIKPKCPRNVTAAKKIH
jgi:signal transduction histidine kinase